MRKDNKYILGTIEEIAAVFAAELFDIVSNNQLTKPFAYDIAIHMI